MLRWAGLENVRVRASVKALQSGQAYVRMPIQFAHSLRKRILSNALMNENELDTIIAECENIAADPDIFHQTFTLVQAWGRVPAQ